MPKALKRTTPPAQPGQREPKLSRRRRRGLYLLADMLRGEYAMTLGMIRANARSRGAKYEHELDEALAWIDGLRRRNNLDAAKSIRAVTDKSPPPATKTEPADTPELFPRGDEPGITSA